MLKHKNEMLILLLGVTLAHAGGAGAQVGATRLHRQHWRTRRPRRVGGAATGTTTPVECDDAGRARAEHGGAGSCGGCGGRPVRKAAWPARQHRRSTTAPTGAGTDRTWRRGGARGAVWRMRRTAAWCNTLISPF